MSIKNTTRLAVTTLLLSAFLLTMLASCANKPDAEALPHGDAETAVINTTNALSIAIDVYRVAAIDIPFTASKAMKSDGSINSAACTDPSAISGSMGDMSQMGMNMTFNNCQLQDANASSHTLIVSGECNNSAESASIETVTGDTMTFSIPNNNNSSADTLLLHGFSVTRNNDNLTKASGTLHLVNGEIVTFNTPVNFSGTASAPTIGSLLITGKDNSTIRFTVLANDLFTMEVDINGDGDYDDTDENLYPSESWSNTFWGDIL